MVIRDYYFIHQLLNDVTFIFKCRWVEQVVVVSINDLFYQFIGHLLTICYTQLLLDILYVLFDTSSIFI